MKSLLAALVWSLRLRHADGSTTPLWENGKDSRFKKLEDTPEFSNIIVRAIPAAKVPPLLKSQP